MTTTAIASESQQRVFDEVKKGKRHVEVQAAPGAGKTYCLLNMLEVIPKLRKTIFLSFSNAIVNELKEKIPTHVKASTLHSLGSKFLHATYKGLTLNDNKYFQLALPHFSVKNKDAYKKCFGIQDICKYARLTLTPLNEEALKELCDKYSIDANSEQIRIAEKILKENTKLKHMHLIDFTDMIYYAAVYPQLVTELYDYVLLDEAQDSSASQLRFVENILRKPNGRLIYVGDHRQSIYSFIGADINSFKKLGDTFNPNKMRLTVTYRVPKKGVELAQTIYPDDIEAHPDAIEGIVRKGTIDEAQEGDMILCRNTKPLVSVFFELINRNKKAFIAGKDYEKGLLSLAETVSSYDKDKVLDNIENKLNTLLTDLIDDNVSKPQTSPKFIALNEKADILRLILEKCRNGNELAAKIAEIFSEDKRAIKLMTAHRAKGSENNRVFFIEKVRGEKLIPSKYAVTPDQLVQENNLLFVVYTRFKQEFIFVDL